MVIGFDSSESSHLASMSNYTFIRGNITKNEDLLQIQNYNIDVIIHLAANANVPLSVKDPIADFTVNALGTLYLLELARNMGVKKFLFASSVSVFDSCNALPISENALVRANSPYGASKFAAENYCYVYNRIYNLNTNVVRLFNVYGSGVKKLFVYDIVKKLLDSPASIELLGDGNQIRDYIYIDDLVEGFLTILLKGKSGEDYNLSSGNPVTIKELTQAIADTLGLKDVLINCTNVSYTGDIHEWYADISKIKKLGFSPRVDLTAGLIKTIDYIKRDILKDSSNNPI